MTGTEAPCPLCAEVFSADDAYAEHLATVHGLEDDEGAETTVEHALIVSGVAGDRALAAEAAGTAAADTAVPPGPVAGPEADDRRSPVVFALAGLALLVVLAVVLIGLGGDDGGGREVAIIEGTVTTVGGDGSSLVAVVGSDTAPVTAAPVEPESPPADSGTTAPTGSSAATPDAHPPTPPPPPTAPPTTAPPTTAPPTTSPPTSPPTTPATTAPPTSAPPPRVYAAPALSGARIDGCQRSGANATWTFSYVLSGGANWSPVAGVQAVGGGRYRETRSGPIAGGFPAGPIQVVDTTTGQRRAINLVPSLLGARC